MSHDQKTTLRALVQEQVHHFTDLKRRELLEDNPNLTHEELDRLQPEIQEYDPVVELAIMGADRTLEPSLRRSANADAAQYLRPKLKSVEMLTDPRLLEQEAQKGDLASRLVGLLEVAAKAKSSNHGSTIPDDPDSDD